jgi:hypothetical protein
MRQPASYQNLYEPASGSNPASFYNINGASLTPFLKVAKILRGCMSKVGISDFNNVFENDPELGKLLLYFANPLQNRAGDYRFSDFKLNRHVPKMQASELTKQFTRFYNLGLFVDNMDGSAKMVRADSLLEGTEYVDWTKIVLDRYTKNESPFAVGKLSMPMPSSLQNLYNLKRFDTSGSDEDYDLMKEGIYKQTDGSFHYRKSQLPATIAKPETGDLFQYWLSIALVRMGANFDYPRSATTSDNQNVFDTKIQAMAEVQANRRNIRPDFGNANLFETFGFFPASYSRNAMNDPEHDKIQLMYYRGLNETGPVASSENKHMYYDQIGLCAFPYSLFNDQQVKIGNKPSTGTDTRQNANHSVQFGGESGVYNRFWKDWAMFLQTKREVEFNLIPSVRDLRRFSLDKKIIIGNQHYLCRSLDIEFSENGIEGAKGTFVQL